MDDNCNGSTDEDVIFITWYSDADSDGFGDPSLSTITCDGPPVGFISDALIATTIIPMSFPDATETCNGVDDDCDSQIDEGVQFVFYADADHDSFGNSGVIIFACSVPPGYVSNPDDCNDNNIWIYPGANEICNGMDDDCNNQIDEAVQFEFYPDADHDGFGNSGVIVFACSVPPGYVSNPDDCNDNNIFIYPGAIETCNGIDDDCNNQIDEGVQFVFYVDADNDGFGNVMAPSPACSVPPGYVSDNTDCNDNNALIFLGILKPVMVSMMTAMGKSMKMFRSSFTLIPTRMVSAIPRLIHSLVTLRRVMLLITQIAMTIIL
jgi:hypothetical protein